MNYKRSNIQSDSFRYSLLFIILVVFTLSLVIIDLLTGSFKISLSMLIEKLGRPPDSSIESITLREFRIPRLITAVIAGLGLSLSGLQMQTIFRNPLAGPYVLGLSSGASLGVAVLVLGIPGIIQMSTRGGYGGFLLVIAAFIGALAILLIILLASLRTRNIMTLLVLGIMLGSGMSAIISILQFFSSETSLKVFVIWTMGSLNGVTPKQLPYLLSGFIPGIILALLTIKPSNAVLLGEEYARSLGVNLSRYKVMIFTSTALMTGTITAFCGPVGFIGLAVPHIARFITGTSRYGILFFFSMVLGILTMLLSDILSQVPGKNLILPLNAVTSLIGIPVVIWILLTQKKAFT